MTANVDNPIRVLVVDDHLLVRKGVSMCLARHKQLKLVGEVGDARDVVSVAREVRPDVILMDLTMPFLSGLDLTRQLRQQWPEVKVVILSIHENVESVRQAMQAGSQGYLPKGVSTEDLVSAVEAVYRGELYFRPHLDGAQNENIPEPQLLTEREREVLIQIAGGWSNKEIAAKIGVSVRTVESHRDHLMRKLNIHSTAGLTRFAVASALVSAEDSGEGSRRLPPGGSAGGTVKPQSPKP